MKVVVNFACNYEKELRNLYYHAFLNSCIKIIGVINETLEVNDAVDIKTINEKSSNKLF